jgi:asparagine synthase (glutamine-hydrolysing)
VTLLAWNEPRLARFDPLSNLAWVGELDAHLPPLELSQRLESLRGDVALIARGAGFVRLARGYFGGRSLYYTVPHPGRSTLVCSRLGPLVEALQALGRDTALDRERLALMMAGVPGDTESMNRSPFEQILRVRPGEILELGATRSTERGALELPKPIALEDSAPEAIAAELRSRLHAVIAGHLAGLDRVAIMASGGVDSSAIVAACVGYARANGGPEIDVLTVDVAGPGDDRPHFDLLCRELGVTPIRFTVADCAPYVRRAWTLDATPCVWPNGAWEWPLLETARARGADVVLTGVGGDDAYEGDPRLLAEDARRGHLLSAVTSAARMRAYYRPTPWGRVRDFVLRPLVTPWIPRAMRKTRLRMLAGGASPWVTDYARDVIERASATLPAPPAESGQELVARLAVAQHLVDPVDARTRMEGAAGCLVRDPLFAPELMDLVSSVPARALLHGDRLRGLFRLALRGLVPDTVRLRSDKASFEPALTEMVALAGGLEAFRDLSTASELARIGLVKSREFERAFQAAASHGDRLSWSSWGRLWPVLSLEAFARAHREGKWGAA